MFLENRRNAVNGSLWSIPLEVRCYVLLGLSSLFGLFANRQVINFSVIAVALFSITYPEHLPLIGNQNKVWYLPPWLFLIGVFFYNNKSYIPLNNKIGAFCFIFLLYSFGKEWYVYTLPFLLGYLLFCSSYKTPHINIDKTLGDISYGTYIYGYPVQQCVAHIFPNQGPIFNVFLTTLFVVPLAYLSWKFIESPAISIKNRILNKQLQKSIQGT